MQSDNICFVTLLRTREQEEAFVKAGYKLGVDSTPVPGMEPEVHFVKPHVRSGVGRMRPNSPRSSVGT